MPSVMTLPRHQEKRRTLYTYAASVVSRVNASADVWSHVNLVDKNGHQSTLVARLNPKAIPVGLRTHLATNADAQRGALVACSYDALVASDYTNSLQTIDVSDADATYFEHCQAIIQTTVTRRVSAPIIDALRRVASDRKDADYGYTSFAIFADGSVEHLNGVYGVSLPPNTIYNGASETLYIDVRDMATIMAPYHPVSIGITPVFADAYDYALVAEIKLDGALEAYHIRGVTRGATYRHHIKVTECVPEPDWSAITVTVGSLDGLETRVASDGKGNFHDHIRGVIIRWRADGSGDITGATALRADESDVYRTMVNPKYINLVTGKRGASGHIAISAGSLSADTNHQRRATDWLPVRMAFTDGVTLVVAPIGVHQMSVYELGVIKRAEPQATSADQSADATSAPKRRRRAKPQA